MQKRREPPRSIFKLVGPGLVTGAADDDPCAIGTYAKAGAALGFSALWLAPATLPMMATVIYLSAKIGLVSGIGLAGVLRARYPRFVVYPIVFAILIANIIEAGADIGAIAAALQLVAPMRASIYVIIVTVIVLVLQIRGSYRLISRVFKWLALTLLSYAAAALLAHPDLQLVLRGTLMPSIRFDAEFLAILVAVIGTTLSPYLFFWEANQQIEEQKDAGRLALRFAAWDINIGMFFSSAVMYSIILCAATTLHHAGQHDVTSAAMAASALEPLAGRAAGLLFALGIIGAGFLAIPVLTTGAAYALAETFDWKRGLNENPRRADIASSTTRNDGR